MHCFTEDSCSHLSRIQRMITRYSHAPDDSWEQLSSENVDSKKCGKNAKLADHRQSRYKWLIFCEEIRRGTFTSTECKSFHNHERDGLTRYDL